MLLGFVKANEFSFSMKKCTKTQLGDSALTVLGGRTFVNLDPMMNKMLPFLVEGKIAGSPKRLMEPYYKDFQRVIDLPTLVIESDMKANVAKAFGRPNGLMARMDAITDGWSKEDMNILLKMLRCAWIEPYTEYLTYEMHSVIGIRFRKSFGNSNSFKDWEIALYHACAENILSLIQSQNGRFLCGKGHYTGDIESPTEVMNTGPLMYVVTKDALLLVRCFAKTSTMVHLKHMVGLNTIAQVKSFDWYRPVVGVYNPLMNQCYRFDMSELTDADRLVIQRDLSQYQYLSSEI